MILASLALSLTVLAAEPSVPVQAEVVFASTAAGSVDPSLTKMRDAMAARVKYLSMKKLEAKKFDLVVNKPQQVALPNQKSAELTLQSVKDDVATLKVKLPPTEAVYTLGREKSLYLQGGAHDGGDLWLVLSQPR
ncbi:MAG: hypothetical protein ACOZQL_31595 [Myxococcota bacterium]